MFELLVKYLRSGIEPKLDSNNAVTILLSAELLGIDTITEKSLNFIAKNLAEVVRNSEDLSSLKAAVIDRLEVKIALPELATLHDSKDIISSRLYQRKLTTLINHSGGEES